MSLITYFLAHASIVYLTVNESFAGNTLGDVKLLTELDTGYIREESFIQRITRNLSGKELKIKVAEDLICSYIFRGLYYIRSTNDFIEEGEKKYFEQIRSNIDFFFVEKVKSMFASLYNLNVTVDLNPIWWLYMYANYFKKVVIGEIEYEKKIGKSWYYGVEERLKIYMNDEFKCDPKNSYNLEDPESELSKIMENNCTIEECLRDLHASLRHQLLKNDKFTSIVNGRNDFDISWFTKNALVDNEDLLNCLTYDFAKLVNWESITAKMRRYIPSKNSNFVPYTYVQLSKYYKYIIYLFKIIMLQIINKHIYYINVWLKNHNNKDEKYVNFFQVNEILSVKVVKFMQLLDIKNDDPFNNMTDCFFDIFNNFTDVKANLKLIERINLQIAEYSIQLHKCKLTIPKIMDKEYTLYSTLHTLDIAKDNSIAVTPIDNSYVNSMFFDTIIGSEIFIQLLEKHLIKNNFKMVNHFSHFIRDLNNYIWLFS